MKGLVRLAIVLPPLLALYGCPSQPPRPEPAEGLPPVEERAVVPEEGMERPGVEVAPGPEGPGGVEVGPGTAPPAFTGHPLDDPDSLLSQRVVYFDFDDASVSDEYQGVIAAHAAYLAEHPGAQVSLEGHADERGSREYNLALGERRAKAVAQLLMLQGAFPDQSTTVSFGEEQPVALGHDESAWSLNRRVEINYQRR
jgi:peptidoglycan-associated lipoprotein